MAEISATNISLEKRNAFPLKTTFSIIIRIIIIIIVIIIINRVVKRPRFSRNATKMCNFENYEHCEDNLSAITGDDLRLVLLLVLLNKCLYILELKAGFESNNRENSHGKYST